MLAFLREAIDPVITGLPLFPLKTVLFPGGRLPLRIFEQRYLAMAKACLADARVFGVCCITQGSEVAEAAALDALPRFAAIGTLATLRDWDMPQLGILHVTAMGSSRFHVRSHSAQSDGLIVAEAMPIATEPSVVLDESDRSLARLLELLAARVGSSHFPPDAAFDDASWVGYRLAELLPLPLSIKQDMLEINDATVRLTVLHKFLRQHGLL